MASAERRLADAEANAPRLTAELDTVSGTFLPEQPRSLRGTFAEGETAGRLDQKARSAERVARLADRRQVATRQRLDAAIAEAIDSLEAAPARYRPALVRSRRAVAELERMADEVDATTPGAGDVMRQAAAEIPTTLAALSLIHI
ncbi:MAG: hypothetical protein JJE52_02915 [Acidimicrobiia bacterium]|nr:hypothetical protein [Acidimicrobiia bacterium]